MLGTDKDNSHKIKEGKLNPGSNQTRLLFVNGMDRGDTIRAVAAIAPNPVI